VVFVIGFVAVLVLEMPTIENQVLQWRAVLTGIQVVIGGLMIIALIAWLTGNEKLGLQFSVYGFLFSLVALQTIYFYLSQFSAITFTLLQLFILQILFTYRRWYLQDPQPGTL
jgi:membrane protein CcdC involved in cytochrome C biogenesis